MLGLRWCAAGAMRLSKGQCTTRLLAASRHIVLEYWDTRPLAVYSVYLNVRYLAICPRGVRCSYGTRYQVPEMVQGRGSQCSLDHGEDQRFAQYQRCQDKAKLAILLFLTLVALVA
jgi:hypothetical protein